MMKPPPWLARCRTKRTANSSPLTRAPRKIRVACGALDEAWWCAEGLPAEAVAVVFRSRP